MGELETKMIKETYSQAGQDLWVLSMFPKGYKGTFLDIGCFLPFYLNNTYLLELNGWSGLSVDIADYSERWKKRDTPFVCSDGTIFKIDKDYDYLSLDVEGEGKRYEVLKSIMDQGCNFKLISIEHDTYRGYIETEREPQRKLLKSLGYELYKPDVQLNGKSFEDWWVNPKLI